VLHFGPHTLINFLDEHIHANTVFAKQLISDLELIHIFVDETVSLPPPSSHIEPWITLIAETSFEGNRTWKNMINKLETRLLSQVQDQRRLILYYRDTCNVYTQAGIKPPTECDSSPGADPDIRYICYDCEHITNCPRGWHNHRRMVHGVFMCISISSVLARRISMPSLQHRPNARACLVACLSLQAFMFVSHHTQ
jgi:hypothetical protein